ncbi:hypothetical protein RB195_018568 [Necator americanus]|uniref:Endonuclease/exonuclease/phosphatase domain-containing protein n=1 Tax=Necator americanus TaxID=51031 RepID=A0ABR1CCI1_NECAM
MKLRKVTKEKYRSDELDKRGNNNRLASLLPATRSFHENLLFMEKDHRWWTCETPIGTIRGEIDFLPTGDIHISADISAVPSFCSDSDHRPLRAEVRLSDLMKSAKEERGPVQR